MSDMPCPVLYLITGWQHNKRVKCSCTHNQLTVFLTDKIGKIQNM